MNIFNRVVVILILIFFVVVSFISIVNEFTKSFKWSDIAAEVFSPGSDIPWYISTLVLLLVIAVCVILLLLEFYRRKARIAKIYNVGAGKAMITVETISQQIRDSVLQINGLKNLKVDITPKSGGVIINMLVELNQNLNIPEKMNEIIKAAKDISATRLNIKVIDTKLTVTNLIPEEASSARPAGIAQMQKDEKNVREEQNPTTGSEDQNKKIEVTGQAIYTENGGETVSDSEGKNNS